MTQPINLPASNLLALGGDAVATLRSALLRDLGSNAAGYLQQAGYAGGYAVYHAFGEWLRARGHGAPESLDVADFGRLASEYFADLGWGSFTLGGGSPVATLDSPDWAEANGGEPLEHPGCHLGTGMLAAFFGTLADQPLAVMEVECRASGAAQCRFLMGSAEVMQQVWEGMAEGRSYEEFIAATA